MRFFQKFNILKFFEIILFYYFLKIFMIQIFRRWIIVPNFGD
jgi:hypothetical protein